MKVFDDNKSGPDAIYVTAQETREIINFDQRQNLSLIKNTRK